MLRNAVQIVGNTQWKPSCKKRSPPTSTVAASGGPGSFWDAPRRPSQVASAQLGAPEIQKRPAFVRGLPAFDIVALNPDTGEVATFYCSVDAEEGMTVPEEKLITVERSGQVEKVSVPCGEKVAAI